MIELPQDVTLDAAIGAQSASKQKTDGLGREDFLRMLVAQLEHQDPLNPQDSTEFTAQLATFSSLEQLIAMRTSIESLVSGSGEAGTGDRLEAASLIGKEIAALGDSVEIDGSGSGAALRVDLDSSALVDIDVIDASGRVVRQMTAMAGAAGVNSYQWDGTDDAGNSLPAGLYHFEVSAELGGESVIAQTYTTGRVTGAVLGAQTPQLLLGGRFVSLEDVIEIHEAAAGS